MHATRLAVSLLLVSSPALSQSLVRDINQESTWSDSDSDPVHLANTGGLSFFTVDDGLHGRELLVSDGSVGGTRVFDLYGGFYGSEPEDPVVFGDRLVFSAVAPGPKRSVWISDGTPEGTFSLTESWPDFSLETEAHEVISVVDDRIHFVAEGTFPEPNVLGISDGTARGTGSLGVAADGLLGVAGGLQFSLVDNEIWRSDGTVAGTVFLKWVGSSVAPRGEALGLFFYSANHMSELVLWRSDGTPSGTFPLLDTSLSGVGPNPESGFAELNGMVYFNARDAAFGRELWMTDGSAAGSSLAFELAPGPTDGLESFGLFPVVSSIGGSLYLHGTGPSFTTSPYASDGTLAGTVMLSSGNLWDGFWSLGDGRAAYTEVGPWGGGNILFVTDGTLEGTGAVLQNHSWGLAAVAEGSYLYFDYAGNDLWKTDGTPGGASLVAAAGSFSTTGSDRFLLEGLGGVWFGDNAGNGFELWRTDGTSAGTLEFDMNQNQVTHGSNPSDLVGLGDLVYFAAEDGEDRELWVSDGTELGTFEIDIWPGPGSSNPRDLVAWNGRVYFGAEDPVSDRAELFVTDGTPQGTVVAVNKLYGDDSLVATDTALYFQRGWGSGPYELWVTDGFTSHHVAGIVNPQDPEPFGDRLAFFLQDWPSTDTDLWITDGTEAGTYKLWDDARSFVAVGDKAVFRSNDVLYVTDGTPEGTSGFQDPATSYFFVPIGDVAIGLGDGALWRTDGTTAGTFEVFTKPSGTKLVWPGVGAGHHCYFWVWGDDTGPVLWRTDGTVAGTLPIDHPEILQPSPVSPGDYRGDPGATGSGTAIAVQIGDATHGREIWIHNPDDTFMLPELVPGSGGAPSSHFTRAGDHVFFLSDAGGVGSELFSFPFSEAGAWVAETYGPGCGSEQVIQLGLDGVPEPAGAASFEVRYAPASAPVAIQYALTKLALPLGQGCEWQLGLPFWSLPLGVADASGSYSLPLTWPSEPILIGLPLYFQALVADPGIAWLDGWALTNGLEVRGAP